MEKTFNRTTNCNNFLNYKSQNIRYYSLFSNLFQCQFGLLCIHGIRPLIYNDCDYPNLAQIIIVLQAIIMLFLFSNFYRRAYLNKKKKERL